MNSIQTASGVARYVSPVLNYMMISLFPIPIARAPRFLALPE